MTACDKTQYDSYKSAQSAISHIRTKNGMKVYKCRECEMFHITSVKKNRVTFKFKEKYKQDYTHIKPAKKEVIKVHRPLPAISIITTYKPFANLK